MKKEKEKLENQVNKMKSEAFDSYNELDSLLFEVNEKQKRVKELQEQIQKQTLEIHNFIQKNNLDSNK